MEEKKLVKYCIDNLINNGAHKAECYFTYEEKNELKVKRNNITLFRTTYDKNIDLTVIKANKKGKLSISNSDKDLINKTCKDVIELSKASQADDANDIAENQSSQKFSFGDDDFSFDLMYDRLIEFLKYSKNFYPKTSIDISFSFTKNKSWFQNSNGVNFFSKNGVYNFIILLSSKENGKSSSQNWTEVTTTNLDKEIKDIGLIDTLLRQSNEQINTKSFSGKIVGDIIMTPDCVKAFIDTIVEYHLKDRSLITGRSLFKDKLNKKIANSNFTLHSKPVSNEITDGYFFTNDGYEAKDNTIIENGILKSFVLSLYGSKKTGKDRSPNQGGSYIIESGNKTYDEMIKSVKKGILLCRLQIAEPSINSDFSTVAKNSYYIEDGKIKYPISDTMILGNLIDMLNNIKAISKEQIDNGYIISPYVQLGGIHISGK